MLAYQDLLNEKRYQASEKSLYYFYKYAWETIDPAPFMDNWHIGLICDHLQAQFEGNKDLQKIIISIQPRVSKSLISSVCYPAWQWLHKPETALICVSHTLDLAEELATKTRDLILSPWYSYWTKQKEIFSIRVDKNQKTKYSNNKHGARLSVSPHKAIHGFGADIIIIDDPNSIDDIYSVAKQDAVKNFHKGSLRNRCNNPAEAKWVLVQQRLGMRDLTQFVLESENNWFHLVVPSEYTKHYTFISPIGKNDPRKEEGALLWPERFNNKWYLQEKRDPFFWASIYQQRPVDLQGNIIRKEWLQYTKELHKVSAYDQFILSIDLALENNQKADYSAFILIGKINQDVNKQTRYYIHDFKRGKFAFTEMLECFKELVSKYSKQRNGMIFPKLIEKKGAGKPLIDILTETQDLGDIVGVNPVKSKEDRLIALQPLFLNKKVIFPSSALNPEIDDLTDELLNFPSGKNDDYVDALSQGLEWLFFDNKSKGNNVYFSIDKDEYKSLKHKDNFFTRESVNNVMKFFEF